MGAIKITLTVADEEPTEEIEEYLPWLANVGRKGNLIPNTPRLAKDVTPIQSVSSTDFKTGLYR